MIKTHDLIAQLQEHIGGDPAVRKCRYLYLYRTPEDALVSTFHLYHREKYLHSKAGATTLISFASNFFPAGSNTSRVSSTRWTKGRIHLVSYDQLLRQTTASF
jgi:hypothetical protein